MACLRRTGRLPEALAAARGAAGAEVKQAIRYGLEDCEMLNLLRRSAYAPIYLCFGLPTCCWVGSLLSKRHQCH